MGQKINPVGLRLQVNRTWDSRWFADGDDYGKLLHEDLAEANAVSRWSEETGKGSRGTAGWADTLEAASDGRVELLLFQAGVQKAAYRCPACGRAALDAITCPLDGTTMEARDDGLDLAVRLTLAHGGEVLALQSRQDLDPVEGIGAILRF